jgi:hypothetical protein
MILILGLTLVVVGLAAPALAQDHCTLISNARHRAICANLGNCDDIPDADDRDLCRTARMCAAQLDRPDPNPFLECFALVLGPGTMPPRPEGRLGRRPAPVGLDPVPPSQLLKVADLTQGPFCKPTYVQIGAELCIQKDPQTIRQGSRRGVTFPEAQLICGGDGLTGRVASYADYVKVFRAVDDIQNFQVHNLWIGPDLVTDNRAFYGNKPVSRDFLGRTKNIEDFEGSGEKMQERDFRCAYNLIPRSLLIDN